MGNKNADEKSSVCFFGHFFSPFFSVSEASVTGVQFHSSASFRTGLSRALEDINTRVETLGGGIDYRAYDTLYKCVLRLQMGKIYPL